MAGRGLFLAIDDATLKALRAAKSDPKRRDFIVALEEDMDSNFTQETDKAWNFLFVAFLTGKSQRGTAQDFKDLSTIFRGPKDLHRGDSYIINLIPKNELQGFCSKLKRVDRDCLRELYHTLNPGWFHSGVYLDSDSQFEYIHHWYLRIVDFLEKMAGQDRWIIFTSSYN